MKNYRNKCNIFQPTFSNNWKNFKLNFVHADEDFKNLYLTVKEIIKKEYDKAKQSKVLTSFKPLVSTVRKKLNRQLQGLSLIQINYVNTKVKNVRYIFQF